MAPVVLIPLAIAVVGAVVQAGMTASAANKQANAEVAEAQRQAAEVNKVATEKKGDRARQADAELGTLRVLSGEGAGMGSTFARQVIEQQYIAGQDISRIEGNRRAEIGSLQAGAKNATRQANQARTSAFVGAGLQIAGAAAGAGANSYSQSVQLDLAQNKVQ